MIQANEFNVDDSSKAYILDPAVVGLRVHRTYCVMKLTNYIDTYIAYILLYLAYLFNLANICTV